MHYVQITGRRTIDDMLVTLHNLEHTYSRPSYINKLSSKWLRKINPFAFFLLLRVLYFLTPIDTPTTKPYMFVI